MSETAGRGSFFSGFGRRDRELAPVIGVYAMFLA
jgi:hypothetical protein